MKISFFENFEKEKEIFIFLRRSCSTSYPSGNQVDGLPLVAMVYRQVKLTRRVEVFFLLEE